MLYQTGVLEKSRVPVFKLNTMSIESMTATLSMMDKERFNTFAPMELNGKRFFPTRRQGLYGRPYRNANGEVHLSPGILLYNLPTFPQGKHRETAKVLLTEDQLDTLLKVGMEYMRTTPYHTHDVAFRGETAEGGTTGVWIKKLSSTKLVLDAEYMVEHDLQIVPVPAWEISQAVQRRDSVLPIGGKVIKFTPESNAHPGLRCYIGGSHDILWELGSTNGIPLEGPITWQNSGKRPPVKFDSAEDVFNYISHKPLLMGVYDMKHDVGGITSEIIDARLIALADVFSELAEARQEEFDVQDSIEDALSNYFKTVQRTTQPTTEDEEEYI